MKNGEPDERYKEASRIHARFELLRYFGNWALCQMLWKETH